MARRRVRWIHEGERNQLPANRAIQRCPVYYLRTAQEGAVGLVNDRLTSYDLTPTLLPPQLFTDNGNRTLDTPTRLIAGALAGITSVCQSSLLHLGCFVSLVITLD